MVNNNPVVQVYVEKKDYELNQLTELQEPVSLDGLLQLQLLSLSDERILTHNVANVIREVLKQSDNYSVSQFMQDCENYTGKPEFRYWQLFERCPEISVLLLDEKHSTDLVRLLSHYAAKQNHFLIEIMGMELQNGVTYGLSDSIKVLDIEQIRRYLFNLQPFKSYQKEVGYTDEQLQFFSIMLLNKAISVAEGVFMAEQLLSSEFGFQFQ